MKLPEDASIISRTLQLNMCSTSKSTGMLCTYVFIAVITVVCWISNNIYSYQGNLREIWRKSESTRLLFCYLTQIETACLNAHAQSVARHFVLIYPPNLHHLKNQVVIYSNSSLSFRSLLLLKCKKMYNFNIVYKLTLSSAQSLLCRLKLKTKGSDGTCTEFICSA